MYRESLGTMLPVQLLPSRFGVGFLERVDAPRGYVDVYVKRSWMRELVPRDVVQRAVNRDDSFVALTIAGRVVTVATDADEPSVSAVPTPSAARSVARYLAHYADVADRLS